MVVVDVDDDATAVADDGFDGLAFGGQFDALLAVAIQNRGHEALPTEPAALARAVCLAGDDFEGVAH